MFQPPSPFEPPEQLADALRELGAAPEELAQLLPTARRLSEWQVLPPSPAETQRLLARLMTALPTPSPVRQAIRERRRHQGGGIRWLLALARTQVSLFGVAFWLVSALVALVGAAAVLGNAPFNRALLLSASGPFLAYLGTVIAFRGTHRRVLECELVCLPSPAQLALARLVIVLGYDVGLGLVLALVLWAGGASQVLTLALAWFMPLLLVAGLALLLSLRLSVQTATSLAYVSWLAVLAINTISSLRIIPPTPLSQAVLGGLGLALLAVALLRLRADMHHLLPQV
jgi:hypothetical protein